MKSLFVFHFIILAVSFLTNLAVMVSAQSASPPKGCVGKCEAERLWELAVEAKGGRERLNSIRNIVLYGTTQFIHGSDTVSVRQVNLHDFEANREWRWNDQRPGIFGLRMYMKNWRTGEQYIVQADGVPFEGLSRITSESMNVRGFPGLIHYFLETRYDRPAPQKLTETRFAGKRVNVVETLLLNERADFYFDLQTNFLIRVVHFVGSRPTRGIRMADYVEVDGINMPSRITLEQSDGDVEYKVNVFLNVDYDSTIFEKPPPFDAGPEAWKKK